MAPARFDQFSKRLATHVSRRAAVQWLGAASLAGALLGRRQERAAADCADITSCYRTCLPEERDAFGFCDVMQSSTFPGGPVGMCWSWEWPPGCHPCASARAALDAQCNQTYPWCRGQCKAAIAPF